MGIGPTPYPSSPVQYVTVSVAVWVGPEALGPPPQGGGGRVANPRDPRDPGGQQGGRGGEGAAGGGGGVGGGAGGMEHLA